ncbi:helix-turn-helix transcriptional regulator [Thermoanaerobacterium sp. CMT5567-10]|uniref:helix-turn-helix transcriptional regulator n=1 Tax=Thermoanaerobacterium sp. CMT5567-10 TaxID=3061989 RepID=UPI0026E0C0AE|nr:helix-turn-helix transcriptional regulator [Thermoanaerobacterium sp. CMT5567-10]WKV09416.1 helix-turn-helix transcriptional regulator [Thermoanaerobacterium sp. CMT5567-10]
MNKIRKFRKQNNMTAKELSNILGISRSYLSMIEIGKRKPNLDLAFKMAKLIGCHVEDLFF